LFVPSTPQPIQKLPKPEIGNSVIRVYYRKRKMKNLNQSIAALFVFPSLHSRTRFVEWLFQKQWFACCDRGNDDCSLTMMPSLVTAVSVTARTDYVQGVLRVFFFCFSGFVIVGADEENICMISLS
jgi:hypothetical protein